MISRISILRDLFRALEYAFAGPGITELTTAILTKRNPVVTSRGQKAEKCQNGCSKHYKISRLPS
jgi:hypothetical protein